MNVPSWMNVTTCRRCGMATGYPAYTFGREGKAVDVPARKVRHPLNVCDAARRLKDWGVRPGVTLHTILRHVSRSGMSRSVSVVMLKRGESLYLTPSVATVIGFREDRARDALKVGGCGMDVGFEVVYNLGRCLFPRGFKLKPGERGRNGDTSGYDTDGGYALKQRWL